MPREWSGWIYIIKIRDGLYKVGRAKNLSQRIMQHCYENPSWDMEIVELKKVKDAHAAERKWHQHFAKKRVGLSEHFALTDDDIEKFRRGR